MGRCCSCKRVVVLACCTFAGCIGEIPPQQNTGRLTGARVPLTGVDLDFLRQPVGRLLRWQRVGQPWQGEQGLSGAHSVDQEPLKNKIKTYKVNC